MSQFVPLPERSESLGPNPVLSIVAPHYDDAELLRWFVEPFCQYPLPVELVIVDDSSPTDVFLQALEEVKCSTRVFRVDNPRPWGMTVASNWGMVLAKADFCLRIDIDHRFESDKLQSVITHPWDANQLARFPRQLIEENSAPERIRLHPNTYVVHREKFFEVGGYDERFVGNYGHSDKDFLARAAIHLELVRAPYMVTTRHSQGSPELSRDLVKNLSLYEENRELNREPLRLTASIHHLWENTSQFD